MDRSLAGRLGIGSPTRPPARPPARARARGGASAGRRPKRRASSRRQESLFDRALARLAALLGATWRLAGAGWSYVWQRRRLRIATIVALIATPLLAGGWLWLRGSSLVAVRHVHVIGARGADARAIDAALSSAAHRMTTLQVHPAQLRAAVASYPVVRELKVSTSFPHGLSIRVVEQPAVAVLTVAGTKTAVAATGVVLGPGLASSSLPVLAGASLPAPGQRLHDAALLDAVAALGAAPAPLAKQVTRAYSSTKGLTIAMHSGLLAYFGDASRPHAKWLSLARVLADPGSAGASYVDVRVPERPAAGFPGGVAPPLTSAEAEASTASTGGESTEALAERLSAAVPGGSSTGTQGSSSSTSGEAETNAEAQGEAQQGEAQSPPSASGETSGAAAAESGG